MTYSVTARREKSRFECKGISLEEAEYQKRLLDRNGWVAIIVRNEETPKNADTNASDASGVMDGIDEHKQTRNAKKSTMAFILDYAIFVSVLCIFGMLLYKASCAFPAIMVLLKACGWLLFAFGLVVVTVKFAKGFRK